MKVYDCQNELKQAYNSNDNFIVTYRTIYEIKHSHGVGEYIKQKVYSHYGSLPLIGKGKFIFTTRNHAESLMNYEGV